MRRRTTGAITALAVGTLINGAGCVPVAAQPTTPAPRATPMPKRTPSPTPAPPEADSFGTIPDSIAGTWLAVVSLRVHLEEPKPMDAIGNVLHVFRFTHASGRWRVEQLDSPPTPLLAAAFNQANERSAVLVPDADAVREYAAKIRTAAALPPSANYIVLATPDQSPLPNAQKTAKDVQLTLAFLETRTQGAMAAGNQYDFTSLGADAAKGRFSSGSAATAHGIVVPLSFDGDFAMYRLSK